MGYNITSDRSRSPKDTLHLHHNILSEQSCGGEGSEYS